MAAIGGNLSGSEWNEPVMRSRKCTNDGALFLYKKDLSGVFLE